MLHVWLEERPKTCDLSKLYELENDIYVTLI